MMDRVIKMTETGGNYDKGYVEAELSTSILTCGSSVATLSAIR